MLFYVMSFLTRSTRPLCTPSECKLASSCFTDGLLMELEPGPIRLPEVLGTGVQGFCSEEGVSNRAHLIHGYLIVLGNYPARR